MYQLYSTKVIKTSFSERLHSLVHIDLVKERKNIEGGSHI